jgi:hypothetical protein
MGLYGRKVEKQENRESCCPAIVYRANSGQDYKGMAVREKGYATVQDR